ncbi:TPA_asm: L [Durio betacytorhabdovirus 1]|nr:TPA_asm: L [Durio betacytorhabdovirus 1]
MDSYDMEDIFERRRMKGLGDYHLRSALTSIDIQDLNAGKGRWREVKTWRKISNIYGQIEAGDPGRMMARLFLLLLDNNHLPYQDEVVSLLSREVTNLGWLTSEGDPCSKVVSFLETHPVETKYSEAKMILQAGLIYNNSIASNREFYHPLITERYGYGIIEIQGWKFNLFGELVVIDLGETSKYLISLDAYRMIVDKATERDNVLAASFIGHSVFPEVYPHPNHISDIFHLFDDFLSVVGNTGYKTLKVYEAVVTGVIISQDQSSHYDPKMFLNNTIQGIDTQSGKGVMLKFVTLIESCCSSPHHYTQIMGLFRLWGHPVIDPVKGMEKVRIVGTARKHIIERTARIAGRQFLEIFCCNYYKKKGSYPPFVVSNEMSSINSYLLRQLLSSEVINIKHPEYALSDWDYIEIQQVFQIPQTFNLSMIVADTAISPTRQELLLVRKGELNMMDADIRRGVVSWMKKGMINCKELLTSIDENPLGLNVSDRVIGEYPKEREMNPVARMFALMSMVMRSYIVITENMLSENVLPLIPGITMTYSLLDLSKEMVRNTAQLKEGSRISRTFCINMDFEKWNLNMRRESTYFVFLQLGRIFGLSSLYNKTYDIFENSIIYLADGSYVPKLRDDLSLEEDNENLAYIGHKGGFEGLRQKGWTIFTVVLITYVCKTLGIKHNLMGQGDNQVLIVEIFSKSAKHYGINSDKSVREIRDILNRLLSSLSAIFADVGLPLKMLETWTSEYFFSYGKFPIYKGLPCAVSLKRISRIFFFSNEDLMTLDNALGAITANTQASVMHDVHPIISYTVGRWQQLLCIGLFQRYHPLVGGPPVKDDPVIEWTFKPMGGEKIFFKSDFRYDEVLERHLMASVPKTLGGFNILTYFDVIMRGFSDPVNKDMQWLYHLRENSWSHFRDAIGFMISPYYSPTKDYLHLIQDPTSLNILTPPNSSTMIKRKVHKIIEGMKFDSEFAGYFKEVLDLGRDHDIRVISNKLSSNEVINPRLCHDIMGATLFGYADSITSKVDKTVTLSRITLGKEDIVSSLVRGECRYWRYFLWRVTVDPGYDPSHCPSLWVRRIRDEGWGKTIIAISTPFPYHFITTEKTSTNRPDSYIEGFVSDYSLGKQNLFLKNSGSALPYLGSITKEKLKTSSSKAAFGTEPLITRPLKLLRAIGWFIEEDSNIALSIKSILASVTDLNPEEVIYIPDHVKGSMMHRYSDMATKHGSLWMSLYGPASHLSISTNSLTEYAKGTKNVTLHFQALLCMVQYMIINQNLSVRPKKYVRIYRSCQCCITPVDDDFEDISDPVTLQDLPMKRNNPYLYVNKDDIHLTHSLAIWETGLIPIMSMSEIAPEIILKSVTEHLALKQALKILYGGSGDESIDDISGIPRTAFLKMPLTDFLDKVIYFVMMGVSQGMSTTHYPSYAFMKSRVLRRLQGTTSSSFNVIAGWFLWEETISTIQSQDYQVMPTTYPITPSGACKSAKLMVINRLTLINKLPLTWSGVILPSVVRSVEFMIKTNLLYRTTGRFRTKCSYCQAVTFSSRLSPSTMMDDMIKKRCSEGHYPLHPSTLKMFSQNNEILDSLLDKAPRHDFFSPVLSCTVSGQISLRGSTILASSYLTSGYLTGVVDCLNFELKTEELSYELSMSYCYPTRAAYKIFDVLEEIPELGNQSYIILGDGYGYTSAVVKLFNQSSVVISWTLVDIVSSIQHCLSNSKPPVHFYTNLDIDNSPTLYLASDVLNEHFRENFHNEISSSGVNVVISDVEPTESIRMEVYRKIIIDAAEGGAHMLLIHIKFVSNRNLMELLSLVIGFYEIWKVLCPYSLKINEGEFWLFGSDLRGRNLHQRSPNYDSQMTSKRLIYQRRLPLMSTEIFRRWHYLGELLNSAGCLQMILNHLDDWFSSGGVQYWRDQDYTRLYYYLKSGKRPVYITDKTGNQAFYLHTDQESQLKDRLLILGLSCLRNIYSTYLYLEHDWRVIWAIDKNISEIHGKRNWIPYLVKDSTEMSSSLKSEILQKLPMISHIYHVQIPNKLKFDKLGSSIKFKSKNNRDNSAHLHISNSASLSLPDSES